MRCPPPARSQRPPQRAVLPLVASRWCSSDPRRVLGGRHVRLHRLQLDRRAQNCPRGEPSRRSAQRLRRGRQERRGQTGVVGGALSPAGALGAVWAAGRGGRHQKGTVSRPPISSGALFAALTRFGLPLLQILADLLWEYAADIGHGSSHGVEGGLRYAPRSRARLTTPSRPGCSLTERAARPGRRSRTRRGATRCTRPA